MLHLTFMGNDAGKLLCNQPKQLGDKCLHYVYADDVELRPELYQPLCVECKAIFDDESNWE